MRKSAFDRLAEEQLYQLVVDEIKRDEKREGLWAKALVEAEGDKEKTQALYIKLRVQSLKDELEYAEHAQHEEAKRDAEARTQARKRQETERKDQIRRCNLAEAELRRLGLKFKKAKSGWIVTFRGKEVALSSIDELEKYIGEHVQKSAISKSRAEYLATKKRQLHDRRYRLYQPDKGAQQWFLEKINGSYDDRQIFNDFEQLKAAVDHIIANESRVRPKLGCQNLILLPAIGLLILGFMAIIAHILGH